MPDSRAGLPGPTERVFLGWDEPPLPRAGRWLLEHLPADMGAVIVALPTARAARRMRALLAGAAPVTWIPPRILTQGELVDELLTLEHRPASRLVRTLAWAEALARLDADLLARLTPSGPAAAAGERRARLRLAETVRTLHSELAPAGRDFSDLCAGPLKVDLEDESERWEALAAAQLIYRQLLRSLEREDPHEARVRAIAAGRIDGSRHIVLVGVADMNPLLARALERLPRVTALIAAPGELAEGFDFQGRLVEAFWRTRDLDLSLERWRVAEKPVDQAASVRDVLRSWSGRFASDEIVLALAEDSVTPYLERQLVELGAQPRRAAGTPLERTRPVRLLRALSRYLARGGFDELAALLRDPDLGPQMARASAAPALDPAELLDAYHRKHLPQSGRADWVSQPERGKALPELQALLERELGALSDGRGRPAPEWAEPLRAWLARVYSAPLDTEGESDRRLAEALRIVGRALGELEEIPAALCGPLRADEAIELLLRSLRGQFVPPAPLLFGQMPVELLGWLDLPLDDAPAVIVTGFNEGALPQALGSHAFLPNSERERLGLASDGDRLARDVYAASLVLAVRRHAVFVTARRSAEGDPLVPSRLAFHRPAQEIPARVRHFLPSEEPQPIAIEETVAPPPLPRVPTETPRTMSVSAFRAYLSSPYGYWLERVLKVETLDDRTRELDPLGFGNLVHEVLERFGNVGPHASTDEKEIAAFLAEVLHALANKRFGARPLPAVELQVEQIEYRLGLFATHHAARAAEGWRVQAAEWKPAAPVLLDVDGVPMELRGRIDRIDVHPDGRWAVLDYKSGEKFLRPKAAHVVRGVWKDLQLPLYRILARELGLAGEPELGYAWIGKDETEIGFFLDAWSLTELDQARCVAEDVIRAVRAGAFDDVGSGRRYGDILNAVMGTGTLDVEGESEDA